MDHSFAQEPIRLTNCANTGLGSQTSPESLMSHSKFEERWDWINQSQVKWCIFVYAQLLCRCCTNAIQIFRRSMEDFTGQQKESYCTRNGTLDAGWKLWQHSKQIMRTDLKGMTVFHLGWTDLPPLPTSVTQSNVCRGNASRMKLVITFWQRGKAWS